MLKLKFQYFGHLMQRVDLLEKTLMLGKIEGRRRGQQRMRWLDGITDSMNTIWASSRRWWRTGKPGVWQSMGSQRVWYDWATEQHERKGLVATSPSHTRPHKIYDGQWQQQFKAQNTAVSFWDMIICSIYVSMFSSGKGDQLGHQNGYQRHCAWSC